jgi:hypothetical protein
VALAAALVYINLADAMTNEPQPPSVTAPNEEPASSEFPAFETCRLILHTQSGERSMAVAEALYTYSPQWGYILRALLVPTSRPPEANTVGWRLVCWSNDENETGFSLTLEPKIL